MGAQRQVTKHTRKIPETCQQEGCTTPLINGQYDAMYEGHRTIFRCKACALAAGARVAAPPAA